MTALIPNMGAAEISMALGTRGPLTTECTACAASAMSIGNAVLFIRAGMADAMLAGGVEAPVVPLGLGGFGTMRALSRRNDDPEGASRPFDLGRDGFILAEGGAVLVLEELERARARGARIHAEIVGYGMSSDAHHVTEPDPVGGNPARAMRNAMVDGGVTPEMIAYVNAHGTSTPAGDAAETRALKLALGEERAYQIPISSTKSETGHLLGAAGALETIITALAMRDSFVPPTINQTDPDPDCDLDYVPNTGRAADVRVRAHELVRVRRPQRGARAAALGRGRGLSAPVATNPTARASHVGGSVAKEISVDISRVGTEAGQSETAASRTRNTCPRCDSHYREEEMVANLRVCAHCGYHFPVTARERIVQLTDEGSWSEIARELHSADAARVRRHATVPRAPAGGGAADRAERRDAGGLG